MKVRGRGWALAPVAVGVLMLSGCGGPSEPEGADLALAPGPYDYRMRVGSMEYVGRLNIYSSGPDLILATLEAQPVVDIWTPGGGRWEYDLLDEEGPWREAGTWLGAVSTPPGFQLTARFRARALAPSFPGDTLLGQSTYHEMRLTRSASGEGVDCWGYAYYFGEDLRPVPLTAECAVPPAPGAT